MPLPVAAARDHLVGHKLAFARDGLPRQCLAAQPLTITQQLEVTQPSEPRARAMCGGTGERRAEGRTSTCVAPRSSSSSMMSFEVGISPTAVVAAAATAAATAFERGRP